MHTHNFYTMKKILFIHILIFVLGVIGLSAQCNIDVLTIDLKNETCAGSGDGTATGFGVGSPPFTYAWSNGQSTETATGLTSGTYTVTATDAVGCTDVATATIGVDPEGVWLMTSSTLVSCNGGSDGTAKVSAMSGVAPFSYNWNDPAGTTTEEATNLTAGQYHVTVMDANGCSNVAPVTIVQPTAIVIIANSTDATCSGGADGTASVTTSGGTGAISFLWSNGATTSSVSNLSEGAYGVTATDANGCTSFTTINIQSINPPIILSTSSVATTCFGSSKGRATVTVVSGNGPFSYLWSNGQTQAMASALSAGTYTVTVTGADGCTATSTAMVGQPTRVVITVGTVTDLSCNGVNDGSISVSAAGGTGPITYDWSNGANTPTISNLAAGTYTVTVADERGCAAIESITITEPSPIVLTTNGSGNLTCNGDSNGSITANASGGTGQISYSWSNGNSGATISNLTAGTYTVTATDANGCTETSTTEITQPTQIIATTTSTDTNCGATDGTASVSASGGTPGYTYAWSNGQTNQNITDLAAGTYTVTVTDAIGCTTTSSVTIQDSATPINISSTPNNTTTVGGNDGAINIVVTGGSGNFTYAWSNGATTQNISGLTAGCYTVTVTDGNGCTETNTTCIVDPTSITVTVTTTENGCSGNDTGTATANPSDGTAPYTYMWATNGGFQLGTTQTITGLTNGTYNVTVTDANGVQGISSGEVTGSGGVGSSATAVNIVCAGDMNGSATANGIGGAPGYQYLWSNGATTQNINGLTAGTYTVTVTDLAGCTSTSSVTISEPTAISPTGTGTNPTTAGGMDGSINLTVTGGTPGYTFLWSNGATTQNISGLSAGCYTVTITDANGCTATNETCITDPTMITVTVTTTENGCMGNNMGTATANPSGGTAPYTYMWETVTGFPLGTTQTITGLTNGTYNVTVTDANGVQGTASGEVTGSGGVGSSATAINISCNGNLNGSATGNGIGGAPGLNGYLYMWSNGETTQTINGLGVGTFTVTVTDLSGCTSTSSVTITEPTAIVVTGTGTNPTTAGGMDGAIDITVSGGTPGYTFLWSNGATTEDLSGIGGGCYTVTVTDANGCTATNTTCINDPTMLNVTVTTTENGCMGNNMGTATANTTDGTPPYMYMWESATGFPLGTTQTITGLTNGIYNVTVTDANGLQGIASGEVTGSGGVGSSATGVNVSCNGDSDGSATGNGIGGAPGTNGYQYMWSNGGTTQTINGLTAGTYTVTVTDLSGCTSTSSVTITEPSAISTTGTVGTNPSTPGGMDGSIDLMVSGGTAPYTFLWSNGETTEDISGLSAGCYTVTITDANLCTATTEICIENNQLIITVTSTPESCVPGSDGTVTATPSGGTAPYQYEWTNAAGMVVGTTATVSGLPAGAYTVKVTDDNGVMATETVEVTNLNTVVATATSVNIDCAGEMNGSVNATATGGTPGYTFAWEGSGGSIGNGATINNLSAGTYTVTATDTNGCTSVSTTTITEPSQIITTGTTSIDPTTPTSMDGSIDLMVSGGTAPYTFLWSNGETTEDISGLSAGCYTVTITDANNCTATTEICLVDPQILITVTSTPESCASGSNDGTVTATVLSGGVAPFTFEWSDVTGTVVGNTATVTGLSTGIYTVVVTDVNGLTSTGGVFVDGGGNVTSTASSVDALCFGEATGSVGANGSGGTPGYMYEWSDGSTTIGNTPIVNGLPAGTYTVTVSDQNGCTSTSTTTINEPSQIITTGTTTTNPSTTGGMDGSIDLMVSGGTAPYTFLWSNGETTEDIFGLSAGCYTVTITDANNCTATAENCLIDPPPFIIMASSSDDGCTNADDGSITSAVVSGGVAPYTFRWEDDQTPPQVYTTSDVDNLPAGTYTVTVTDDIGQTATETVIVGTEPGPSLDIAATATSTCEEMIPLSATTAQGTTITWYEDLNGLPISNSDDFDYVLSNGENVIYAVAELNGCETLDSVVITQNAIDVSVNNPTAFCQGTMAQVMATNNNPNDVVTYEWTPASAFSAGANTATPTLNTNLVGAMELYLATENQFGCTQLDTIDVIIQDTTANFIETHHCTGLVVDFANTNTSGPTEYLWDFGDGTTPILATNPTHTYATTGMYTVTMTLPPGTPNAECLPEVVAKEVQVADDPIFTSGFAIDYDGCSEDSVTVVFTDTSSNVVFNIVGWDWDFPNGDTSAFQQDSITITESGSYSATLMVFAEDGCVDTVTQNFDIEIFELNLIDTVTACIGTDVALNPFGNPAYNYNWSPADGFTASDVNPMFTAEATTNYSVTITNPNSANSCEVVEEVFLFVPQEMSNLQTSPDVVVCQDSMVTLNASSPEAMGYMWFDNGMMIGEEADLPLELSSTSIPQYYYVEAMDEYGCITIDSVLAGNAEITALTPLDEVNFCIGSATSVTTEVMSNGTELMYEWSNATGNVVDMDSALTITPAESGTYFLNVSNEFGCEYNEEFELNAVDLSAQVTAVADPDTIFVGETTQLEANHLDGNYTYVWDNEGTLIGDGAENEKTPVAMPGVTTLYGVTVTDTDSNCSALANILITVVDECDEPFIFFPNAFSPNDDGQNDVLYLRSVVVDEVYFVIYNRWGEKVFESNNVNEGWDGTHDGERVTADVYGFYLEARCINGKEYVKKGNVTVFN